MTETMRKTGIDSIGDVPWGTHFCHFYQTKEDLVDILVPYFKAGLENKEFCMWVASEPLTVKEAEDAMKTAVRDFPHYLKRGQIEIIPYTEWYLKGGVFNLQRVLTGWRDKLKQALDKGYEGMRITGNTAWLEKKDWRNFADYEREIDNVIGKYPMMAICSYSLDKCRAHEVIDVVRNHQFALIKREGELELFESSERKRTNEALRKSDEKYRILYETIKDGIIATDMDGCILECNQAYMDMLGYSRDDIKKLTYQQLTPNKWHQMEAEKVKELIVARGYSDEYEKEYIRKDGTAFPVSIRVWLIRDEDGKPKGMWGIVRDVTERKHAEEELKRYAAQLNRSNEELQNFAYVASHDLQEPLRMISSYLQLIERRYKGKLDTDADEFIAYAVDGANRMQKMINGLLEYSRVGTREKHLGHTDCEVILQQSITNLKIAIEENNVTITHDPLPAVMADSLQLMQVFQNLIGNAIKFRGNEPPHIHVSASRKQNECIFTVHDNGMGIDPEYKELIFALFRRLHGSEYPGVGLGLSICKKIIHRHGGQIWVESERGKGSTFHFTIPIKGG